MTPPLDHQHLQTEIERNRSTRQSFAQFASHRERVMQLLLEKGGAGGRLLLLGAGNCNDIDLPALLQRYAELHLVDCDGDALNWGVLQQRVQHSPAITLHGGVDLSAAGEWDVKAVGQFDVVASLCVLSQLVDAAAHRVGSGSLDVDTAIRAAVIHHQNLMRQYLAPSGWGIVISDFASSSTFSALKSVEPADFPAVAMAALRAGRFFRGLHPGVIHARLCEDDSLAVQNPTNPWNWNLGERVYAVSATCFQRKG